MIALTRQFEAELAELNRLLGTDFAIVSKISGWDYEVLAVVSNMDAVKKGDHFVTKDTYCNEVIEKGEAVTYDHVGTVQSMVYHPIYTAMQLESYLGVPLKLAGEIVGTLNFSGFSPKSPGFTAMDVEAAKSLAAMIEKSIQR